MKFAPVGVAVGDAAEVGVAAGQVGLVVGWHSREIRPAGGCSTTSRSAHLV